MSARKRRCPTPNKAVYPSRSAAERMLRQTGFSGWKTPIRAYRCKDHYHVTSRVQFR